MSKKKNFQIFLFLKKSFVFWFDGLMVWCSSSMLASPICSSKTLAIIFLFLLQFQAHPEEDTLQTKCHSIVLKASPARTATSTAPITAAAAAAAAAAAGRGHQCSTTASFKPQPQQQQYRAMMQNGGGGGGGPPMQQQPGKAGGGYPNPGYSPATVGGGGHMQHQSMPSYQQNVHNAMEAQQMRQMTAGYRPSYPPQQHQQPVQQQQPTFLTSSATVNPAALQQQSNFYQQQSGFAGGDYPQQVAADSAHMYGNHMYGPS